MGKRLGMTVACLRDLTFAIAGVQAQSEAVLLHIRIDGAVSRAHCLVLPLIGRYGLDCGREPSMSFRVNGTVFDVGTRWILAKIVIAFPILRWPDWSWNKATTAVRTDVAQYGINTRGTERTLIGTDARFK